MNTSNEVCVVNIIDAATVDKVQNELPGVDDTARMADLFKALADSTRLRIVQALLLEELCVCDISAIVNVSISAISHQLRLLRNMRIVKNRKQGKMVYYSLDDDHILKMAQLALEHIQE